MKDLEHHLSINIDLCFHASYEAIASKTRSTTTEHNFWAMGLALVLLLAEQYSYILPHGHGIIGAAESIVSMRPRVVGLRYSRHPIMTSLTNLFE